MPRISALGWALIVVGVVFAAIGIIYLVVAAPDLPGFFPGHVDHAFKKQHYNKRGAVALVVALAAFGGAFFASRKH